MKYCLLAALLVLAVNANAQSRIHPSDRYKQKRLLDSLRDARKSPAIITIPGQPLTYNTPVAPIANEGEKAGMSGQDTIYKMKRDNMRILKPNTRLTAMPNATEGKVFMVPPVKKKP